MNPNTQSRPNSKSTPGQPRPSLPQNIDWSVIANNPSGSAVMPNSPVETYAPPTAPPQGTLGFLPPPPQGAMNMQRVRQAMPPMGPGDVSRGGMSPNAMMAQQRRNRVAAVRRDPNPFNQFTGGGAQYIGARNGEVLYDYGNGKYRQGTRPDNLRDVQGNWTFLRS